MANMLKLQTEPNLVVLVFIASLCVWNGGVVTAFLVVSGNGYHSRWPKNMFKSEIDPNLVAFGFCFLF